MPVPIRVHISYFAVFREQRGLSQETLATTAATAGEFFDEVSTRYAFTIPPAVVRVAINKEFRTMDAPLAAGDEIVFVPPVAGG